MVPQRGSNSIHPYEFVRIEDDVHSCVDGRLLFHSAGSVQRLELFSFGNFCKGRYTETRLNTLIWYFIECNLLDFLNLPQVTQRWCQFLLQPKHPTNDGDCLWFGTVNTCKRTIGTYIELLESKTCYGFLAIAFVNTFERDTTVKMFKYIEAARTLS